MTLFLSFFIGFLLGGIIGIFVTAILTISKRSDEHLERFNDPNRGQAL